MANTGYEWSKWTELLSDSPSDNPDPIMVLTQGGTTQDRSDEVDLNLKSACEVSLSVSYTEAQATTALGLEVYLLRGIDNSDYETMDDGAFNFLMEWVLSGTRKKTISVSPADMGSFKLGFKWTNTQAGSTATISAKVRTATIPAAS